jgi:hypothetical protein
MGKIKEFQIHHERPGILDGFSSADDFTVGLLPSRKFGRSTPARKLIDMWHSIMSNTVGTGHVITCI